MKNVNLPLIPSGATSLGDAFSIFVDDKFVTWYHQLAVINHHPLDDTDTYRYMLGFMHVHNGVPQAVLARATGFHANSVMKYANIYRESGLRGFFSPVRMRGASVLVPGVLSHCQGLLDQGLSRTEVAGRVGIKKNTLDKAIRDGRLQERRNAPGVTRSDRARADRSASSSMGSACAEISGRVLASLGRLSGVTKILGQSSTVGYYAPNGLAIQEAKHQQVTGFMEGDGLQILKFLNSDERWRSFMSTLEIYIIILDFRSTETQKGGSISHSQTTIKCQQGFSNSLVVCRSCPHSAYTFLARILYAPMAPLSLCNREPMPEAAVHLDNYFVFRYGYIRLSEQCLDMETEAEAHSTGSAAPATPAWYHSTGCGTSPTCDVLV